MNRATPSNNLSYKAKGDNAMKMSHYNVALKYYKKALAMGYSPEIENNIGVAYMALDRSEKAMKAFDHCIEGDHRLEFQLNRVRLKAHVGQYEDMLKELNSISCHYESGEIWYQYGLAYEGLRRKDEALAAYIKAFEVADNDKYLEGFIDVALDNHLSQKVDLWLSEHKIGVDQRTYLESRLARSNGEHEHYVHAMEMLLERRPKHLDYVFELIDYFVDLGEINRALEFMEQIPKEFQSMEEVWYYRVIISKAAGHRSDFHQQVAEFTNKWKDEARKVAVR